MATNVVGRAALLFAGVLTAVLVLDAASLEAAPPRSSRYVRPAPAKKPAPKPAAEKAPETPAPTPPQPRRESEAKQPAAMPAPPPASAAATEEAPLREAPVKPRTTDLFEPPPVAAATAKNGKYLLRYQFRTGETVRWLVEHDADNLTTVQGTTMQATSHTASVKAWKVKSATADGGATFVHAVESIDMRQKLTGRQETRYNSRTDKDVPPIFAAAAAKIGVPLTEVTIDGRGRVVKRLDLKALDKDGRPAETASTDIMPVLPETPIGVGESWTAPFDITAKLDGGAVKVVKARRKVTLESVEGNTAILRNDIQILSPLDDPAVEAQVAQNEQSGRIVFDLARGRLLELVQENDREIFGFQGEASVMHQKATFTETLVDADGQIDPAAKAASLSKETADDESQPAAREATGDDKTARRAGDAATK